MVRRLLGVVGLMLGLASPVSAATYYVDYASGADTNNGTATTTPWKRAPGMVGCANTCAATTLAAGDTVVFKGGVTWPSAALPLTVTTSGSSGNPITFGVDVTWYTGSNSGTVNTSGTEVTFVSGDAFLANDAWDGGAITINGVAYTIASVQTPYRLTLTASAGTQSGVAYSNSLFVRPVFDAEGLKNSLVSVTASYITLNGLELTGQMSTSTGGGGASLLVEAANGNVRATHLDVHNWRRCTGSGTPTAYCAAALTDNSYSGGGIYVSMFTGLTGTGIALEYSHVGNPENGGDIGACTRGMQTLIGNYLRECSQACLHGCQVVRDNVVENVGETFDGTTHTNIFYSDGFDGSFTGGLTTATAYIYNNWVIDPRGESAASILYPNPGTAGVTGTVTYYIFNNVVTCTTGACAAMQGTNIDPFDASATLVMNIYVWNNTIHLLASGICTNVTTRTYPPNIVDVRNQHCITVSGGTQFAAGGTTNPASSNLLLQTTAAAGTDGYSGPQWAATLDTGDTVQTGVNLTAQCVGELAALCRTTTLGGTRTSKPRPATLGWDIGAHQFLTAPETVRLP